MDDALNALLILRGMNVDSSSTSTDVVNVEKSNSNGINLIAPSEWKRISALSSIATLARFTSPPPEPPPARSLLALASNKIRMTSSSNATSNDTKENMNSDHDDDFDPVSQEGKQQIKREEEEKEEADKKESLMVVVQGGVIGAKLTKEVVIVIDALCGTILKSPTYHSQKMCEYALDCIAVLITNGYIYGTVGLEYETEESTPVFDVQGNERKEVDDDIKDNSQNNEADGLVSSTEILEFLIMTVCKCSDMTWSSVQEGMIKVLLALVISPRCTVHGATLLKIVRSIFHVFLVTKSSTVKNLAKNALLNIASAVFNRMEAYDAICGNTIREARNSSNLQPSVTLSEVLRDVDQMSISEASLFGDDNDDEEDVDVLKAVTSLRKNQQNAEKFSNRNAAFASQFHTDGYLLFRAICKLSAKSLPEDNMEGSLYLRKFGSGGITDPLAFQTKLLSLEMLIHMFEHSDTVFTNGERFIYGIQQYLCVSLLKNCMSLHSDVGHAALKIFLVLVSYQRVRGLLIHSCCDLTIL